MVQIAVLARAWLAWLASWHLNKLDSPPIHRACRLAAVVGKIPIVDRHGRLLLFNCRLVGAPPLWIERKLKRFDLCLRSVASLLGRESGRIGLSSDLTSPLEPCARLHALISVFVHCLHCGRAV